MNAAVRELGEEIGEGLIFFEGGLDGADDLFGEELGAGVGVVDVGFVLGGEDLVGAGEGVEVVDGDLVL